ncbi:hypothetical protein ACHRVK_18745 [Flavobacterium plurextorum]|uniref:Uncharacterized protein n=1 Tax=Flavobacterium potami TaxID=2872310 RepID=A0A9X1HAJ2_9FLAO|nr:MULTISPECIES: hypothetical protein [Flavobacterium]MBZ4035236.1 hypothetical protein [Flavobacterium potami]WET02532.1 hypothetical protein P0R33_22525 [Flavobacterium sp. YJ01]
MEIDKFNGVTNGEFIDYFKIDLHSRMEILSYTYPHELLDEDSGFGEHVQRCIALLKDYMIQCRRDSREAEREMEKRALENAESGVKETGCQKASPAHETPDERRERLRLESIEDQQQSELRYGQLRSEIDKLIDEHRVNVKIIYVEL